MKPPRCYMDSRLTKHPGHYDIVAVGVWGDARVSLCLSCLDKMLDKCDAAGVEPDALHWVFVPDQGFMCVRHRWNAQLCADWLAHNAVSDFKPVTVANIRHLVHGEPM